MYTPHTRVLVPCCAAWDSCVSVSKHAQTHTQHIQMFTQGTNAPLLRSGLGRLECGGVDRCGRTRRRRCELLGRWGVPARCYGVGLTRGASVWALSEGAVVVKPSGFVAAAARFTNHFCCFALELARWLNVGQAPQGSTERRGPGTGLYTSKLSC